MGSSTANRKVQVYHEMPRTTLLGNPTRLGKGARKVRKQWQERGTPVEARLTRKSTLLSLGYVARFGQDVSY